MSDKVLVCVPVMDEEKTVKKVVDEIYEKFPNWDVIVVDDASEDSTIKEAEKTKARIIPFILNTKGSGSDLIAFMIANDLKYDYLLKIDGDGQQEVDDLDKLVDALKKGLGDIVVGSRYVKKQEETDSFIKVIGRVFTSALINFKVKGKNHIADSTSGIRAWNYKSIKILNEYYSKEKIIHDSLFWMREGVIASKKGLKIHEIPAYYKKREFGESKSFSLKNMIGFPVRFMIFFLSE